MALKPKLSESKAILTAIIAIYLVLAVAYASTIPKWNAPDEPSHYNYVKNIAEHGQLPILKQGDYDFGYLEKLKAARFPDGMSIDSIRYESHQPPLYYLLATPIFWATTALPVNSQVIALRLLSALFGALTILVGYRALRLAFGNDSLVPVASAAFIASVPMYIHLTAAINNDSLANLLLSVVLLGGVSVLVQDNPSGAAVKDTVKSDSTKEHLFERVAAPAPHSFWKRIGSRADQTLRNIFAREYVLWGVLLGLNLLTKTTASTAVVLVAFIVAVQEYRLRPRSGRTAFTRAAGRAASRLARIYAVALAISGWWFIRNVWVYGNLDVFGLKRHDLVVVGQPLTGPFTLSTAKHFFTVSFQSFWAQFGWMGILVDQRIYTFLWTLCALAGFGFVLYVIRVILSTSILGDEPSTEARLRHGQDLPNEPWVLGLLALCLVLLAGGVIQYNLTYIQAQGRYFFPAIVPIAAFFVLGIREIVSPRHVRLVFVLLFSGMFLFDLVALSRYILPTFSSLKF